MDDVLGAHIGSIENEILKIDEMTMNQRFGSVLKLRGADTTRRTRSWVLAVIAGLFLVPAHAAAQYARPTTDATEVEIAVIVLDVERIDDAM